MPVYDLQGRWRVWRNGAPDVLLPEWVSYEAQIPRSGVGGFNIVLPLDALNVPELVDDLWATLALEVLDDSGDWWEPPRCRFLPVTRNINLAARTLTLTGASYGWLLGKAIRWPDPGADNEDGEAEFNNATAGHILQWHYYWAMLRRAVQNLTMDWDASTDSAGEPWVERYDVAFAPGVTLRQIFDGFAADGIAWRTNGDTLQVVQGEFPEVPDETPVLRAGIECSVENLELTLADSAGAVLLTSNTRNASAAVPRIGPWGRLEVAVSQQGSAEATMRRMAGLELAKRGASRQSVTVKLLPSSELRPFDSLMVGQQVTVRMAYDASRVWRWDVSRWDSADPMGAGSVWSQEATGRVEELVVADDGAAVTATVTVGERASTAQELIVTTVQGVTGGRIARQPLSGRTG